MNKLFLVCFLGFIANLHSQENYLLSDIDLKMLIDANALVRENTLHLEINDVDNIEITTRRVVTVFNESGEHYIDAYENYDDEVSILDQEAIIYNAKGEEIKKIKKRDFKDQSNFQNFVLFSDNRISYLDYTPRSYPYTVEYTSKIRKGNSVFLPDWWPLEGFNVSVQKSTYKLTNNTEIPVRFSERNLDSLDIISANSNLELEYSARNIPAITYEPLSPSLESFAPRLLVALEEYELEGIRGKSTDWENFGKWQYDNLVAGRDVLPDAIVSKMSNLTKSAETIEEKARIIYNYVQNNTRYIAVMLGIGGWKPYTAAEVDRLGYGDCKGLSNYTMALLASQGIESNYTVVYGGTKRDIDPDFTKMQGNHIILSIPQENKEDIWLECTSQDTPFNYLGDFTDNRFVLKLKPEGGEIVKTKRYSADENLQTANTLVVLKEDGGFDAEIKRTSYGVPYGDIYLIENQIEKEQKRYYREEFSYLQNINFEKINFSNDKRKIEFVENLEFSGAHLCSKAGNRLLLPLNFLKEFNLKVDRVQNRKNNLKIERGKTYKNEISYQLPVNYSIEALPKSQKLKTEFGELIFNINKVEKEGKTYIVVDRYLKMEEGEWLPEKFENFREFINKVHSINNQKAVIIANTKT
ncbi:DUF3857 domain-containing protein [Christiangramia forsetii]|uniref:DUF3857 domain-containing protein n=2 Tax=Christiangramia forsetii TaxID=411153 RepID=A0LY88_CHRFK|nr:DUF3857 domain-containing protein [Christiangramia forsetii]GGG34801.1 hypothetical protein GCM10011532_18140 [Christiangramia forsetii]CAL65333.1 conserved hypothetical protein [Christiangramia forsetii KT0803]